MSAPNSAIVAISSHVVRGAVGNRAVVFALETLGFPVWSVPTVLLPWHPGHGVATRITPDGAHFSAMLDDLACSRFAPEVRAVLSGYMGSVEQVEATANFVQQMRAVNPELFYTCDPVIGDEAGLYVSQDIAAAIQSKLLPLADLITPNRFELSWLLHSEFSSNDKIAAAVRVTSLKKVLVTSAFAFLKDGTGNLYIDGSAAFMAEHRQMDDAPNGTGDLTAALFTARLLSGLKPEEALKLTTQSVAELLYRTAARGSDELTLALDTQCLVRPTANVQTRHVGALTTIKRAPKRVR